MRPRLGRLPALIVMAAVASAAVGVAFLVPASPSVARCAAAGSNSAAIVVEHGDGSLLTRCVAFDTTSVTGEGLLNLATPKVAWSGQTFGGFGVAVCAIDAEPAHYSTCPGKDNYWAVFVSTGGAAWQLAGTGISSLRLSSGDALGFRYVPAMGTPPAPPSAAGVCPGTSPTASAAATATAMPAQVMATAHAGAAATATAGSVGSGFVAGVTSAATAGSSPTSSGRIPDGATVAGPTAPVSGSGSDAGQLDLGLLAACVVGGGLAGLALLRLIAARRRRPVG